MKQIQIQNGIFGYQRGLWERHLHSCRTYLLCDRASRRGRRGDDTPHSAERSYTRKPHTTFDSFLVFDKD